MIGSVGTVYRRTQDGCLTVEQVTGSYFKHNLSLAILVHFTIESKKLEIKRSSEELLPRADLLYGLSKLI